MYSTTGYRRAGSKSWGRYIVTQRSVSPSAAFTTTSRGGVQPTSSSRPMSASDSVSTSSPSARRSTERGGVSTDE